MEKLKAALIRAVELINSAGFALIVGSVVYFILGTVAKLVGSTVLSWTFCGSAHRLMGVEWCEVGESTGYAGVDHFLHRLLNAPLPWFMIFWGFVLTGVSILLLKMLGAQYKPPGSNRK